ncbi:phosphoenolpyruvate--protein phosphotransferase [endosymbiont of unidentified scaly snail isolate Monju]|uniref:phosphoenolpyruvate--protein phosphotransferase n=1 Tax=endosymbiont of unidentified scaly snail isolate Monju TaxID=1248727 RepID=UPI0003892517|nr:phosphoenolpyruvate--protein phosphotransferase [endosymbiont of unidentified scaly snail isolate Monju]BAN70094.1 phosphotransferase system, enzyme I, PtsI [endosymbiont of unidentified scaly snail isolate Monju]
MIVGCVGIGVGAGARIAIGEAFVLCRGPICVSPAWVRPHQVEDEVRRFEAAVGIASQQLQAIRDEIPPDTPGEISEFIDSHLLMIEDRALSSGVASLIRQRLASAEWALQQHCDALVEVFEQMQDAYLRTRRDDLIHVVQRILKVLTARHDSEPDDLQGQIVLAEDLSPADVILLHNRQVAGFVTEHGGPMSHTAILARSLGIPAVIGAHGAGACLKHGELLVLDTDNGCVLPNCDPALISHFQDRREYDFQRTALLRQESHRPATTRDGLHVRLLANIELAGDVAEAVRNGADGIGLYRTEFLFMNRNDLPDEEEHFAAYREVIEGMPERAIVIRTLDLGADKPLAGTRDGESGSNPALGLRAIRLCLKEPELFKPQLRAILRASALGDVSIMLPMLTNLWEVEQTHKLIRHCMHELDIEGTPYNRNIPVGGMIEVPAAALATPLFARALDFLSIGTNDLIQYTLAIDRVDNEVNYLYDPLHPAILQLIARVIEAGRQAGIPVSMCGEMAGDPRFIPLLIGMGLHELSMQPAALLDARQLIRELDAGELVERTRDFFEHIDTADPLSLLSHWQ